MTTQKQTQKKRPRGWFPDIRGRRWKENIVNNIMISLNADMITARISGVIIL